MIISNLISSQLPAYVVDNPEYSNFVSFLEAYYEWMESESVLKDSVDLLNLIDIDNTIDSFVDYFYKQYIPEIPKHIATDKRKLIRFIREFYKTKGTSKSYKFLFRALFDSDCQLIETDDFVLKGSAGIWFNPVSLKIKNDDIRFLSTEPYFILGEKSNTLAKIETVKLVNEKIEIFLSDIKLLFDVTEYVRIVDSRKRDVLFDLNGNPSLYGDVLRSQLYRPISNLTINPKFRGNYYSEKNPVVIYGGLDHTMLNPKGAKVEIGSVNAGYITKVEVDKTSCLYGYRDPETEIRVFPDNKKNTIIEVDEVDYSNPINLTFNIISTMQGIEHVKLEDLNKVLKQDNKGVVEYVELPDNITKIKFKDFQKGETIMTGNLVSVITENGGGGFSKLPELTADGMYASGKYTSPMDKDYDPRYDIDRNRNSPSTFSGFSRKYNLIGKFGILAPLTIESAGLKYKTDDAIIITNKATSGAHAYARIKSVDTNGAIKEVEFYENPTDPNMVGGVGFRKEYLDKVSVTVIPKAAVFSSKASWAKDTNTVTLITNPTNVVLGLKIVGNGIPDNTTITKIDGMVLTLSNIIPVVGVSVSVDIWAYGAVLKVSGILGASAVLIPTTERIGSINSFRITDYGEDYVTAPKISMRIEDVLIKGFTVPFLLSQQTKIFNTSKRYFSYFNSIEKIHTESNPLDDVYVLRIYDYNKSLYNKAKDSLVTDKIYFSKKVMLTGNVGSKTAELSEVDFELDLISSNDLLYIKTHSNPYEIFDISGNVVTLERALEGTINDEVNIHFSLSVVRLDDIIGSSFDADLYNTHLINNGVYYDFNYEADKKKYNAGVITYGDGTAKATAKFLNGIILGDGRYLDERGHVSSYNVLQDDNNNGYSYILSVEVELLKFKKLLKDILHPAGTQVITQISSVSTPHTVQTKLELGAYDEYVPTILYGILSTEKDTFAEEIYYIDIVASASKGLDYITVDDLTKILGVPLANLNITGTGIPAGAKIVRRENKKIYISQNTTDKITSTTFRITNSSTVKIKDMSAKPEFIYADNSLELECTKTGDKSLTMSSLTKENILGLVGKKVVAEPIRIKGNIDKNTKTFNLTNLPTEIAKLRVGQYVHGIYDISGNVLLNETTISSISDNTIVFNDAALSDINTDNEFILPVEVSSIPKNVTVDSVVADSVNKTFTIKLSDSIKCDDKINLYYFIVDTNTTLIAQRLN